MAAQWDASMVTLRNGRTAAIRSVAGREDAEPIQRFIRGLSARSRYQRPRSLAPGLDSVGEP